MLKIYGSDLSSPANKVRFAANALNLQSEYIKVNLREGEQRKEWFLKLNPASKIPVIDDNGFVLFESNAIIRYLADKINSPLYPKELKDRAVVDQWIDFGSMHVGLAMSKVLYNRVFYKLRGESVDERSLQDGLEFLKKFLPVVDEQLAKNNYIAGKNFTIADINLLALLDPSEIAQVDIKSYNHLNIWRSGLRQKEFYTSVHKEYGELLKQAPAASK
jgi:glutathione S-transferase